MRRTVVLTAALLFVFSSAFAGSGCGKKETGDNVDETRGRPEAVTAYEAVQYTKPAADKWQPENWVIQVRSDDPDGMNKMGKAKIWLVFYFSPTPETNAQMFVMYNRGRVWPNAPGLNKGGEKGRDIYRKNRPPNFRVDSPEAYTVALRNGGGEYLDGHPDALVNTALRCKADYDAVDETLPAPQYKWVWEVMYRQPVVGSEDLYVLVDGMNGDFISKEARK